MKILPFLLLFALTARAQQTEGIVVYERVTNWPKLYARLTFLSQEEKDRLAQTWKNDAEFKEKTKLFFSPARSLYTHNSEAGETENGDYSYRQRELVIQRDFDKERKTEIHEMLGKTYILDDSLRTPTWKILNEIKEVAGHVCMKATTEDPIKKHKITVWFAQDIAVSAGPERWFGLPGLILELDINDGDVTVTAQSVAFQDAQKGLTLPKLKGKRITDKTYNELLTNHIRDSIAEQNNPYWTIRY
jgi:GLPGLI family protein